MPNQQFDELDALTFAANQDSTFNPATEMDLSGNDSRRRRVDQVLLSNGDTTDKTFAFIVFDGSGSATVADLTVAAGVGHGAVPPLDAIVTLMGTTYPYLMLPPAYALHGKWSAAPGAGKLLSWLLKGGSF